MKSKNQCNNFNQRNQWFRLIEKDSCGFPLRARGNDKIVEHERMAKFGEHT